MAMDFKDLNKTDLVSFEVANKFEVKIYVGRVVTYWGGKYPRLVVRDENGDLHYLKDKNNVRVFNQVAERFVSLKNANKWLH